MSKWLDYNLYIGDADERELYEWCAENISPVLMTTQAEFDYYKMYHGDKDLWILHTTDVSDVSSSSWDTITLVSFKNKEDAIMTKLRFGGAIQ